MIKRQKYDVVVTDARTRTRSQAMIRLPTSKKERRKKKKEERKQKNYASSKKLLKSIKEKGPFGKNSPFTRKEESSQ